MERAPLILLITFIILPFACARICNTVDVRNDVVELEKLRGCNIITGDLFIVLLENVTAEEFDSYTFPELEEINGYLLMYKVAGLRTLGKLFPNLSVIKGHTLFMDYAFTIYNLDDLEEVGCVLMILINFYNLLAHCCFKVFYF